MRVVTEKVSLYTFPMYTSRCSELFDTMLLLLCANYRSSGTILAVDTGRHHVEHLQLISYTLLRHFAYHKQDSDTRLFVQLRISVP